MEKSAPVEYVKWPWDSERPETFDACGVYGVYDPGGTAARYAWLGAHELQHRGQDASGIGVVTPEGIVVYKDRGLITEVLPPPVGADVLDSMGEGIGISVASVRWGTVGASDNVDTNRRAAMPHLCQGEKWEFQLVHNGQFNNLSPIAESFGVDSGRYITDSEAVSLILNEQMRRTADHDLVAALETVLPQLSGAYALVLTDTERLIGVRDPNGVRPLCIGRLKNGYVLSSETCALDVVGATFIRDVEPGEIVIIDEKGLRSSRLSTVRARSLCIFEFPYIQRPDSELDGVSVQVFREHLGALLAEDALAEADAVLGVPDSGTAAAIGYAEASGIRLIQGILKGRNALRTFIMNNNLTREEALRLKLHPIRAKVEGKRLVVVDDSVVRGNTTRILVKRLRELGALEIHLRIPYPPHRYPCYFGVNTPNPDDLLATGRSVEDMCREIGADSLGFLSIDRLKEAARGLGGMCMACVTGNYPTDVPRGAERRLIQLRQAHPIAEDTRTAYARVT